MNTPFEQYIRSRLIIAVATVLGIGFAVFAGKLHGSGKTLELFMIFGAIGLTVIAVKFQAKLWILIPVFWTLTGKVSVLPVPFSVRDLIVMYIAAVIVVCIALKIVRKKPKYDSVDVVLLLNYLWLLSVFVRNPVGVAALDSDRVGGKPYFDAMIAYVAYLILTRINSPVRILRQIPWVSLAVLSFLFLINSLIYLKPSLAPVAMALYSGFSTTGLMPAANQVIGQSLSYETSRFAYFVNLGNCILAIVCSYYNTLKILTPIYWKPFSAFCFGISAILISGFRSALANAALFVYFAAFFQRGWKVATRLMLLPVVLIFFMMLGHGSLYDLPYGAQRAISFIPEVLRPTKLNPAAIEDAEGSTRWRVEMWKDALTTERYISNKWLGDGFGLTRWQYHVAQSLNSTGQSWEDGQEGMAIAGLFHSGPISAIRFGGYIGLILVYISMIMLVKMSFRIIKKAKDTPLFPPALFFGIPVILYPIMFTFIFGSYEQVMVEIPFELGIMKLLENSLDNWSKRQNESVAT